MPKIPKTKEELRVLVLSEIQPNYVCPEGIDVEIKSDPDHGWRAEIKPPPGPIPYADCANYIGGIVRRLRGDYGLST